GAVNQYETPETMISPLKVARYQDLFRTSREAGFLGRGGKADAGYLCLLAGRRRAEEARRAGEPWAEDLVERYRLALEGYARQYGLLSLATMRASSRLAV